MEKPITLTLNGEPLAAVAGDVAALLRQLGHADRTGIAVAVNGRVVPRSGWSASDLHDGDSVEIVGAVQGG